MEKNITDLGEKSFDKFVKEGRAVVDFWAEWCGPCKMMSPIFEDVASELKGKVKFGKVDVEKNQDLAQRFQVMSIPTLIFFDKGKQITRSTGVLSKAELIKKAQNAD